MQSNRLRQSNSCSATTGQVSDLHILDCESQKQQAIAEHSWRCALQLGLFADCHDIEKADETFVRKEFGHTPSPATHIRSVTESNTA
jgi:hypothetical protein